MIYHILLAFVVTFIITVVLGKIAIPMLRSLHAQQSIRDCLLYTSRAHET